MFRYQPGSHACWPYESSPTRPLPLVDICHGDSNDRCSQHVVFRRSSPLLQPRRWRGPWPPRCILAKRIVPATAPCPRQNRDRVNLPAGRHAREALVRCRTIPTASDGVAQDGRAVQWPSIEKSRNRDQPSCMACIQASARSTPAPSSMSRQKARTATRREIRSIRENNAPTEQTTFAHSGRDRRSAKNPVRQARAQARAGMRAERHQCQPSWGSFLATCAA